MSGRIIDSRGLQGSSEEKRVISDLGSDDGFNSILHYIRSRSTNPLILGNLQYFRHDEESKDDCPDDGQLKNNEERCKLIRAAHSAPDDDLAAKIALRLMGFKRSSSFKVGRPIESLIGLIAEMKKINEDSDTNLSSIIDPCEAFFIQAADALYEAELEIDDEKWQMYNQVIIKLTENLKSLDVDIEESESADSALGFLVESAKLILALDNLKKSLREHKNYNGSESDIFASANELAKKLILNCDGQNKISLAIDIRYLRNIVIRTSDIVNNPTDSTKIDALRSTYSNAPVQTNVRLAAFQAKVLTYLFIGVTVVLAAASLFLTGGLTAPVGYAAIGAVISGAAKIGLKNSITEFSRDVGSKEPGKLGYALNNMFTKADRVKALSARHVHPEDWFTTTGSLP